MDIVSSKDNQSTDYQYIDIVANTQYLKYSKTLNSLPLTSFKFSDGKPCIHDQDYNVRYGKYLYPLEIPMGYGCDKDEQTKVTTDPRY